jgi:type VI secretion system protein ImpC
VAATPEKDDAVGRILDLVDAPDHQPAVPAVSAVSQFVSNVAAGRRTAPVPSGAAEAVRFAEQAYMAQLDEVLSHPEFQDTEATWRGLKFLVDRTDFRKGVYLEVLDTGRADLAETFHERVFVPEYEGLTRTPLSLAVACFELGNTPGDIDLLDTLGREAEEIQAPVLFSVGRGFFGPTAEDEGGGLPSPRTLILSTAYLPWRALCEKEHARWLAAAVNRFVLRTPHAETRGQETQRDSSPGRRGSLFGSPVWVVARCIAASRARSGWPTECMGFHNGAVDNLQPIPPHHVPLEMALSQEVAEDLVNLGFMPLIATPHSDSAYVLYAPSLHQPREGKAPRLQLSLPYQLLAATLARAILDRKAELTAGKSPEEIQQALELFLSEFVVNTGPGAGVAAKVTEDREDASRLNVALQVLTGDGVLGGARIEFGFGVVR